MEHQHVENRQNMAKESPINDSTSAIFRCIFHSYVPEDLWIIFSGWWLTYPSEKCESQLG
jgi:hypothetical protein